MAAFTTKEINEAKVFVRIAAMQLDSDRGFFQDETLASDLNHLAWTATLLDAEGIDGTDSVWLNQDLFLSHKSRGADFVIGFVLHQNALDG
jgi:hypothetical protein